MSAPLPTAGTVPSRRPAQDTALSPTTPRCTHVGKHVSMQIRPQPRLAHALSYEQGWTSHHRSGVGRCAELLWLLACNDWDTCAHHYLIHNSLYVRAAGCIPARLQSSPAWSSLVTVHRGGLAGRLTRLSSHRI